MQQVFVVHVAFSFLSSSYRKQYHWNTIAGIQITASNWSWGFCSLTIGSWWLLRDTKCDYYIDFSGLNLNLLFTSQINLLGNLIQRQSFWLYWSYSYRLPLFYCISKYLSWLVLAHSSKEPLMLTVLFRRTLRLWLSNIGWLLLQGVTVQGVLMKIIWLFFLFHRSLIGASW